MTEQNTQNVAGKLEKLKISSAKAAEKKKEYERLCAAVRPQIEVDTKPRSSNTQQTVPGFTKIESVDVTSDGLVIKAIESDKGKGVSIRVLIRRDAIPSIIGMFLAK